MAEDKANKADNAGKTEGVDNEAAMKGMGLDLIQKHRPELLAGKDLKKLTVADVQGLLAEALKPPVFEMVAGTLVAAAGPGIPLPPALTEEEEVLIAAGCQAYGIAPKYVLGSAVRDGVAVIVTQGGSKVRFAKGDKVEALHPVQVTGIAPKPVKK